MNEPSLVELRNVCKRYPGVVALDDVTLTLRAGTVTALAGENGAGKSTLIKVLSGAVRADSGEVRVGGASLPSNPGDVIRAGVSTIYQELTDVPEMSVVDNVLLARHEQRLGFLRERDNRSLAAAALARVGLKGFDLHRPLSSLSPAQRQLLEIARCVARNASVLIFDEPTSSLPEADVEALMGIIRQLRSEGLAILYVSHHLEELFAIADDIVVMRDGSVVASRPAQEWTHADLVRAMLAKDLKNAYPWTERPKGPVFLEVKDLVAPGVRSTSFAARSGEIIGLVGLDGAGRTELLKAIAGATRPSSGSILVEGEPVQLGSIVNARKRGIVYAPEDRKAEGLILDASIRDNVVLGLYSLITRTGFVLAGKLDDTREGRGAGIRRQGGIDPANHRDAFRRQSAEGDSGASRTGRLARDYARRPHARRGRRREIQHLRAGAAARRSRRRRVAHELRHR